MAISSRFVEKYAGQILIMFADLNVCTTSIDEN